MGKEGEEKKAVGGIKKSPHGSALAYHRGGKFVRGEKKKRVGEGKHIKLGPVINRKKGSF